MITLTFNGAVNFDNIVIYQKLFKVGYFLEMNITILLMNLFVTLKQDIYESQEVCDISI